MENNNTFDGEKGGRDVALFQGINDKWEFLCTICEGVPVSPKELKTCSHIFCEYCITSWLSRSNTCPICREPTSVEQLINPPIALKTFIQKLISYCDNKAAGCPWTGEWSNLPSHIASSCGYAMIPCSNLDCPKKILRKEKLQHESECDHRLIQCTYCRKQIKAIDFVTHFENCDMFPTKCEFCSKSFIRSKKNEHIELECTETVIPCSFQKYGCEKKVKRGEMNFHLKEEILAHLQYTIVKYDTELQSEKNQRQELKNSLENQILEQKTEILKLREEIGKLKQEKSSEATAELEYLKGLRLWEKEHWSESLTYFSKAADMNYPPAYLRLYCLLEFEISESEKWRQKATNNLSWFIKRCSEDPKTQFNLAYCYYIMKDISKAYENCVEAASSGYAPAQWLLGNLYLIEKVQKDKEVTAINLLESAARYGFAPAQISLGRYLSGFKSRREEGQLWIKKAADQGAVIIQITSPKQVPKGKIRINK